MYIGLVIRVEGTANQPTENIVLTTSAETIEKTAEKVIIAIRGKKADFPGRTYRGVIAQITHDVVQPAPEYQLVPIK